MRRAAAAAVLWLWTGAAAAAMTEADYNAGTLRPADVPADAPRFEQFPAQPVPGLKPAPPDVRSHPRSREFRTMIRRGAGKGPNFAGHFSIVTWGCGSGCIAHAIVDAASGRVFHPPNLDSVQHDNIDDALAAPEGRLVKYRLDSRLLVVVGGINDDPALRGISWFTWDGRQLQRIRFVHRPAF